jgi:hypothetical protein
MTNKPPKQEPPKEEEPKDWEHYALWQRVKEVLYELPSHFKAVISVSGIPATDIFALGGLIGAAIEDNVVKALNSLRDKWDPDGEYADYEFERRPETFPDVRLKHKISGEVIMAIELKGWYLLAKETEPSFRFRVTPAACASQDLLVVLPWALENVMSGNPKVFPPFVIGAKFASQYRNYWWQHMRNTQDDTGINIPENATPYPEGREAIEDKPVYDDGNNFGRLARCGIMDEFVKKCHAVKLSGFKVSSWHKFLKNKHNNND